MKNCLHSRLSFLFFALSLISCESTDGPITYEENSNEYVNDWMYNQMKRYYLWNNAIKNQGNLALNPKEYFKTLLQSEDIYSYALHPEMPETAPQSLRSKFGFDVSFIAFEGKYYGVILYVLEDSPAKNNGLQRGQFITHVDGTELKLENYDKLYTAMTAETQLDLKLVSYSAQLGFSNPVSVSISQGFTFSQPITYQVIEDKNTKIGYVNIPHFDVGQAQLYLQLFQELKSASITELVLDLRYNGGGDISSAAALSIILAPNIKAEDLFIKFEGNQNGGNVDQSFAAALKSNEFSVSFDALRNSHPSINKVYILCGKRTASASELIINNLKPYMEVITIGEKTFGKDVAGFPIADDRNPVKRGWVLYPSIYKLFNARHEGNYSKGINPEIYLNELQQPEVYLLGSHSETLLQGALNNILGNTNKIKTEAVQSLPLSAISTDIDPLLQITP